MRKRSLNHDSPDSMISMVDKKKGNTAKRKDGNRLPKQKEKLILKTKSLVNNGAKK